MFATAIRYMAAKKPKPKMKPIELKTPPEQTQTITRAIFDILKEHGPLTIAETWERVQGSWIERIEQQKPYENDIEMDERATEATDHNQPYRSAKTVLVFNMVHKT